MLKRLKTVHIGHHFKKRGSFCGKKLSTIHGLYYLDDEPANIIGIHILDIHSFLLDDEKLCLNCLNSDEYILYRLKTLKI